MNRIVLFSAAALVVLNGCVVELPPPPALPDTGQIDQGPADSAVPHIDATSDFLVLDMRPDTAPMLPDATPDMMPDAAPDMTPCVPQPETCDGTDEDCDGLVDEQISPIGCVNEGVCAGSGPQICAGGQMTECDYGDDYQVDEQRCDQLDNDCDGVIDEGCECTGRETRACGTDVGDCRIGTQTCIAGIFGDCIGGFMPQEEACDGVDNDCDGTNDEGVANACGFCGGLPSEVCDGIDDDCDGNIDEGTLNRCGSCGDEPPEVCNGEDDDCDDRIDENTLNACGECGEAPPEVCDGADNDCDGTIDEGTLNGCGGCGELIEICNGLDEDCDGDIDEGVLNACDQCGEVPAESCDGLDNDCDGSTDEEVSNACGGCGPVPAETCNANDDNCDGEPDNIISIPCPTGLPWPCQAGMTVCENVLHEVCRPIPIEGVDCAVELLEYDLADALLNGRGIKPGVPPAPLQVFALPDPGEFLPIGDGPVDGIFVPHALRQTTINSDGQTYALNVPVGSGLTTDVPAKGPHFLVNLIDNNYQDHAAHSIIELRPNLGVTFDLDHIRSVTGREIIGFTTRVGSAGAETGVFVIDGAGNGQAGRLHNEEQEIDLQIAPETRFLTLITTDAQDDSVDNRSAWFGDPTLHLE